MLSLKQHYTQNCKTDVTIANICMCIKGRYAVNNYKQQTRQSWISDFVCSVQSIPPPFTSDNRLVQYLQSSVCPYCVHAALQLHGPVQLAVHRSVGLVGHFSFKSVPSPYGILTPRNTL